MDFSWNHDEKIFREEVRTFFKEYWSESTDTPERSIEKNHAFEKLLAEHGWLTMAWPTEYGGKNATHIEQMIFREEATLHEAPTGGMGPSMIGPCLIVHGTEEQRVTLL